jgi:ribosomal protein S19E (S16A)
MKYSAVIASLPRNLRLEDACDYVAGETLLRRLERAGWLKPTVKEKGVTAYDRQDLDRCIERAKMEGWPK